MDLNDLIVAIAGEKVNITSHARVEAREDSLSLEDIFHSTQHGEVIDFTRQSRSGISKKSKANLLRKKQQASVL